MSKFSLALGFRRHRWRKELIEENGFLSDDIDAWVKRHRTVNAEWLSLAHDLNKMAHRALRRIQPKRNDNVALIVCLLFLKGQESFQSALILAERGLTGDAKSALRSAFEALFCFGACKDNSMIERLKAADLRYKKKLARSLLDLPADLKIEDSDAGNLQRFLDRNPEKGAELEIWAMAKEAGLEHVYRLFYSSLSHESTHPSVSSLDRHLEKDENLKIIGLRIGPDVKDVGTVIALACVVELYFLQSTAERFPKTAIQEEVADCFERYKMLMEKFYPNGVV